MNFPNIEIAADKWITMDEVTAIKGRIRASLSKASAQRKHPSGLATGKKEVKRRWRKKRNVWRNEPTESLLGKFVDH